MRALAPSLLAALLLSFAALQGCGGEDLPNDDQDSGIETDAGSDAGGDAGSDAGEDAGADAGEDAGSDAGEDAGADAGEDAGSDAGEDAGSDAGEDAGETVGIRVLAANLSSGNGQSYDPGHGARIMQGVDPDIVLIQEFNYGDKSQSAVAGFVNSTFPGFEFYSEGTAAQIPNGVISRWPIISAGKWEDNESPNREFVWARIDIPGPVDLWAVSLHLLTRNSSTRNEEARQLVGYIQANVPAGDYLVLGGDLNTDTRSESAFSTLSSVVVVAGPHPVDQNGAEGTNAGRTKPYDGVYADPDLKQFQVATVIGQNSFPAGLVVDTRTYQPISDLAPALTSDSAASSMQHMGVVKDFSVPLD